MGLDLNTLLENTQVAYNHARKRFLSKEWLLPERADCVKSNTLALEYRSLGNQKYKAKEFLNAKKLYTHSISLATMDSEELVLAYGNRSAVSFQQHQYISCLLDVNRALTSNNKCPEESKEKLLRRKRDCLDKICTTAERNLLADDNATDLPSTAWSSMLARHGCLEEIRCSLDNILLPNTSSKIGLVSNEEWGRYLIATSDIEPGEILGKEKFFVTFLNSDLKCSNCSHCLVRCEALIPCPSCALMMYCSDICQKQAFNSYHRAECPLLSFLLNEKIFGHDLMAIRSFLVGTEQGANLQDLMKILDVHKIFEEKVRPENKPFKADYLAMLRQRWTFENPPMEYVTLAVKVIVILQHLGFFDQYNPNKKDCLDEMALFSSLLLINNLDSVKFHNQAISERLVPKNDFLKEKEHPIGCGIALLHNMMNHSCNPNVNDSGLLQEHFIYSIRPIKKGEQIFISYCTSFAKNHIAERRRKLALYGFTCHCEACSNDWPIVLYSTMSMLKPSFLTTNKMVVEKVMTTMRNLIFSQPSVIDGVETMQEAIELLKLLYGNVREPYYLISLSEGRIQRYMRKRYGNYYIID